MANLLLKPRVTKECIINTYLYNRMLSFLTVTSTRHPPAHPAGEVAPRRAAMSDRRPETIARRWICAGLSGGRRLSPAPRPSEAVARRRIASVVHSFVVWRIRPDHGRILTICLRAVGLRAGPSLLGADRLRRSPIGVRSSESFAEVIDKLGIIDCGRFAAKSSDNYATWSGKRRLNPSL